MNLDRARGEYVAVTLIFRIDEAVPGKIAAQYCLDMLCWGRPCKLDAELDAVDDCAEAIFIHVQGRHERGPVRQAPLRVAQRQWFIMQDAGQAIRCAEVREF